MRAKQISHFFQNLKPETAIWLRLGYSPKQKPQRKGGVLWRLRLSRRARRDAARPQVQGCSCPLNQRCCESAGGEIVVTGLSGFAGVAAVAGGGGAACAGTASCAVHERCGEQEGRQHSPKKCAPEGQRRSNQGADENQKHQRNHVGPVHVRPIDWQITQLVHEISPGQRQIIAQKRCEPLRSGTRPLKRGPRDGERRQPPPPTVWCLGASSQQLLSQPRPPLGVQS
jgi:hypothetical protein